MNLCRRVLLAVACIVSAALVGFGTVGTYSPAAADANPVVLEGTVRSPNGSPLEGIGVECFLNTRPGPYVIKRTGPNGHYSFRRHDIVGAAADDPVTGCAWLGYFDPHGRWATEYADDTPFIEQGRDIELPLTGGPVVVKNVRLAGAGQLSGTVTNSHGIGLFGVSVHLYRARDKKQLARTDVSPFGTFRFIGIPAGHYKVKFNSTYSDVLRGYRTGYSNGRTLWSHAPTVAVRVGHDTGLGRVTMVNTRPFFTSATTPSITNAASLTPSTVPHLNPGGSVPATSNVTTAVVSRSTDPLTGAVLPTSHPWARANWDVAYVGDWDSDDTMQELFDHVGLRPGTVVGRRFVLVVVHNAAGRASVVRVSAATPPLAADH